VRRALPRALRVPGLDGGVPRLFGQPAVGGRLPLERRGDRCRDQPDRGAGLDRGQRSRAATRPPPLDRRGHERFGHERNRARPRRALALGRGARIAGGLCRAGDGGVGHAHRRPGGCRSERFAGRGAWPLLARGFRRRTGRAGRLRRCARPRRRGGEPPRLGRRLCPHMRGGPRSAPRGLHESEQNAPLGGDVERIWLKSYPPGVPADIDPSEYKNLVEVFDRSVQQFTERPAYHNMGRTLTYAELERRSRDFGAWLQAKGLAKGARVAIMLPNCLQYPIAMFGTLRAGCTVVNVNPLYTARELD